MRRGNSDGLSTDKADNTDCVFDGDATRQKKHDYRLKLGAGIAGPADIHTKWWEHEAP